MKVNRLLGTALAVGLGLAALSTGTPADAQGTGRAKKAAAAPAPAADPPTTKKPITMAPPGIAWGMNPKQLGEIIDKMLDEQYRPIYAKTSPGVKMKALDAQLAEEKSEFRRSRIEFGKVPTGLDSTPLRGEYTYLNRESMMTLSRAGGEKTYFFFIQDRLWKIIEDSKFGEDAAVGKDFQDAVVKLSARYEVPGRVLPADPQQGRPTTEVDWKDAASHLRAIQRSATSIAMAFEDNITLGNLASLRANKPADDSGIDPAVAAAVRKDEPPPPEKSPKPKK